MQNFVWMLTKRLRLRLRFAFFVLKINLEFLKLARRFGLEQTIRCLKWVRRGFESPAPNFVKWEVLKRYGGNGIWIETGTYLGETTDFLSKISTKVISIEPSSDLVHLAKVKFEKYQNVLIIHGTSEESLHATLSNLDVLSAGDLNFWLDGHYSAGITYLGDVECPVPDELSIIQEFINPECKLSILIDDVRSFSPTGETRNGYPSLSYLPNWADTNHLTWTIEHDIFIMTNRV
jgi:hypothetical protein